MTFQFQCPHGHVLEGDPSWAGQQCTCPQCQVVFIVPYPAAAPMEPAFQGGPVFPDVRGGQAAFDPVAASQPKLYHVPCPNGHELETPPEMFGQDVLCPHCGVQFNLREKDSVEFKRKKSEEQERKEIRSGKAWLQWSVVVAVLVGILILFLIFSAS